jgi:putative transposase
MNGKQVIAFLKQLLKSISGEFVIIWDNAPIHTRKLVRTFINAHKRMHVEAFPTYAPELNPAEFIWSQTSQRLSGMAPDSLDTLAMWIHRILQRIRSNQSLMWACVAGTPLRWRKWHHVR